MHAITRLEIQQSLGEFQRNAISFYFRKVFCFITTKKKNKNKNLDTPDTLKLLTSIGLIGLSGGGDISELEMINQNLVDMLTFSSFFAFPTTLILFSVLAFDQNEMDAFDIFFEFFLTTIIITFNS